MYDTNSFLLDKYIKLLNYLTIIAMYLKKNFFLRHPIAFSDIKEHPTGHWGNASQINFLYSHISYFVHKNKLRNTKIVIGTGHSGIPLLLNTYFDKSLHVEQRKKQIQLHALIKNFGTPLGFKSEITSSYPGIIYAGGELGYSLATSIGYVLNNKNMKVFCVIGDGEAETGSIAASWHYPIFLDRKTDGIVIPIINLNGYKMGNRSILSYYSFDQISNFFSAHGLKAYFAQKDHTDFSQKLESVYKDIINWRIGKSPKLPVIIFISEKGDNALQLSENVLHNQRMLHKNPLQKIKHNTDQLKILENWLKEYYNPEFSSFQKIMTANFSSILPSNNNSVSLYKNNKKTASLILSKKIKNKIEDLDLLLYRLTQKKQLLVFSPDELYSNKFVKLSNSKLCYEILNEQICQSWLWGNACAGKRGLLISYEGFMPVLDSMLAQLIKFIADQADYKNIRSINYLLTSLWWENCYSHQNPGFINSAIDVNCPFLDIQFPLNPITASIGLYKNFNSYNTINIMSLSKNLVHPDFTYDDALKLVENGLFEVGNTKFFDFSFFIMGDALFYEAEKISIKLQKEHNIKSKIVYFYNINTLRNLSEKDFYKLSQRKKVIFFFQGYPNSIRGILFSKTYGHNISVYGYNNIYYSGNIHQKIEANGMNYEKVLEELMIKI